MKYFRIGNVAVVPVGTVNPYCSENIMGTERSDLLGKFCWGYTTPGYEFWHAPGCGGAIRLDNADNVDPEEVAYYWGPVTRKRNALISAAARAVEVFDADELERFAEGVKS